MNNLNTNESISNWMRYSVSFRVAVIGVLALLLLIPVAMVQDLIRERQNRQEFAVMEMSQKWGGEQTIAGPILSVPYKKYTHNGKGETIVTTRYAHFLPESLNIDSTLNPEIRSRGIFDAVVYSSEIDFSGNFKNIKLSNLGVNPADVDWANAFLSLGITDTRGVGDNVNLKWDNANIQFSPGVKINDVVRTADKYASNPIGRPDFYEPYSKFAPEPIRPVRSGQSGSGVSTRLPSQLTVANASNTHSFSFKLKLNGSQNIQFAPVGRTTEISMKSDWNAPSFSGAFLPDTRTVTDEGFEAFWKVLDINRGYPQSWLGSTNDVYSSAFGVKLLTGVDGYTKSTRSAKYALLMISLTFLVFFFVEIFNKTRIHPIQYILVGLALVLFYSLLISISEILGFGNAYLISGAATIGLVTLYSKSVLGNSKTAFLQGAILVFLYIFIYIILQSEDYTLLIGSILLFSILSAVMYLSRKIDWYSIGKIQ